MSFGWSAGDIVTALRVLYKVGVALREAGGASSHYQDTISFLQTLTRTLEHLNALQSTNLDADVVSSLVEQCDQIRCPLEDFLRDVAKYRPALGVVGAAQGTRNIQSKRSKVFSAPRKLQWVLSASKDVKKLQDRIAVPMAAVGLLLGQQIVLNTLKMPADIQPRMASTLDVAIDSKIRPFTESIKSDIESLSHANVLQKEDFLEHIGHCHGIVVEEEKTRTLEIRQINSTIQNGLDRVIKTQVEVSNRISQSLNSLEGHSSSLQVKMNTILKQQSDSTDFALRTASLTEQAMRQYSSAGQSDSSKLHQKLNQVDASMQAIQGSLHMLSRINQHGKSDISTTELQKAVQDILRSIWLFLSSFQFLVRQILVLLAPYLVALYRGSLQMFILHGDRFLFEDALGRIKRLPCAEFQHWDTFHRFLVSSFKNEPGMYYVLKGNFMIMNGYNNFEIEQETWRAVIQPRTRVKMAMLLDSALIQQGRCPDITCDGRVPVTLKSTTQICPVCGKQFLKAEKRVSFNKTVTEIGPVEELTPFNFSNRSSTAPVVNIGSNPWNQENDTTGYQGKVKDITEKIIELNALSTSMNNLSSTDTWVKDLTAFKRVAWRDLAGLPDQAMIFECTFLDCEREFTSVEYWRIHENTHIYPEEWRCPQNINPYDACAFIASTKEDFQTHLRQVHRMAMKGWITEIIEKNHLGPGIDNYWDGFCREVKGGNNAARLVHIEKHFSGAPNITQKTVQEWFPINSQLSKGEIRQALKEEKVALRRTRKPRGIMKAPREKFEEDIPRAAPYPQKIESFQGLEIAVSESSSEEALKSFLTSGEERVIKRLPQRSIASRIAAQNSADIMLGAPNGTESELPLTADGMALDLGLLYGLEDGLKLRD